MKKKIIIATALVATLGSGVLIAGGDYCQRGGGMENSSWGGHHGGGKHGGFGMHKLERLADKLELSDEQRDKVFAIIDEARPEMRKAMFGMKDQRKAFMQLDSSAAGYSEQSAELASTVGDSVEQMVLRAADIKARVFAELTEEQRAKAVAMMEKRGKGRWM